jgi:exonuclease III
MALAAPAAAIPGMPVMYNPRGDYPPPNLPLITIASQNCNSLNISTECRKQLTKMLAITALLTDFIFLSDIRLNSSEIHIERIKKHFLYEGKRSYKLYTNSNLNRRGVGILMAADLPGELEDFDRDNEQNLIAATYNSGDGKIRLVSIYGPNSNDFTFFDYLNRYLLKNPNLPVIIAGDWNCTYSCDRTDVNIDIFRMANPPSLTRSGWLNDICTRHHLTDPFRALGPDYRDYTYTPGGGRANRSRLDFFIIGDELIGKIKDCKIVPHLGCNLLDHKAVTLTLNVEKTKPKIFINPSVFSYPRADDVVWAAVADCYLNHAVPDQQMPGDGRLVHHAMRRDRIGEEKFKVGNLLRLITEYNTLHEMKVRNDNGNNDRLDLDLAAKNTEIRIQRDSMWDIDVLTRLELVPSDEYFLESLLSCVKGSLIGYQTWFKRMETAKKSKLIKDLNELKLNYEENANEILTLENTLNEIVHRNVQAKVKTMKIFECLNAEKPTPMFLNLAKKTKSNQKLENIKKPDGTAFESDRERNEYIVTYYSTLYKKPDDERIDFSNCIENFLGPDICGSRLINNSKLTDEEQTNLDMPLTIDEIDKSMEKANLRSAPGMDGISNKLLKRYWPYFRIGIHKYALRCFETGRLTDVFRGATVKLIPKKGDLSQLKNWRPISLLSNVYKILSRALNNRLNRIVNRVCSRAQKGFNDHRYTQEVLINVIETIAHCNVNGVGGGDHSCRHGQGL